jgi:hypothetical protein
MNPNRHFTILANLRQPDSIREEKVCSSGKSGERKWSRAECPDHRWRGNSARRLSCWLLASLWLASPAQEKPEPQPAAVEAMAAAQELLGQGKADAAEEKLRAALREPGVEPGHPLLGTLNVVLARICRGAGRHDEAFTAAATAAQVLENAMGAENPFSLSARWFAATEALAAEQPANAAAQAAPLLATLRPYVTSGRAVAAHWEDIPQFREVLATMPPLNEAGIAAVTALLGRAWAAAGEEEKALPLLKEAAEWLERLHGPGHPELVAVSEVLEQISAHRGEALGRRYVGGLGFFSKLVLEGNTRVPAKKLRQALGMDMEVVLASHPAANLADFLPVIARQLERGYHHSGFPTATVAAVFDPKQDGGRIVVTIQEGPCYKMGKILVEGAKELVPDQLRDKLLDKSGDKAPPAGTLAAVILEAMVPHEKLLPQPEAKAAEELAESLNQQIPNLKWKASVGNAPPDDPADPATKALQDFMQQKLFPTSSSSSSVYSPWKPDDPAEFPEAGKEPHLEAVQYQLATLGRPLARLHTSYALRDEDGTADLVIRLEDEGPLAVVGRIQVIGASLNTAEEITAAAGLKSGQPFVPGQLDGAVVALWNTGRFFPFAITPQPRGNGAREVDFSIRVVEIPTVPPLSATLSPEQEAAQRFIRMVNEWAATGEFTDFLIASKGDGETPFRFGFSSRDGLLLAMGSKEDDFTVTASISRTEICCKLTFQGRDSLVRLPVPTDHLKVFGNILPSGEETKKLTVGFGCGFSSLTTASERFTIRLALSPAIPLLEPDDFRRDGEEWVFLSKGTELLRFNLATGLPVTGDTAGVEFRDGVVREAQQALADQMDGLGETEGVQSWLEAARTGLRLMAENDKEGKGSKEKLEQWNRWLRFASALTKPELIKPFTELWTKWTADTPDEETFSIPTDPAMLQQFGMMNLLVGFGAVAFSEMLAPPDSWVSKLGREMVFFQGGKTQYTARTMQELLADPTMGPIGCMLTAQLIANYDGAAAERFLRKALTQATAEGFRQDWQLVINSPTGLGQAVEEVLAALAGIREEEEQELAAQLEPELAAWLTGFLDRLRELPATDGLAAWIAPQMDALWTNILSEKFRRDLDQRLNPAVDAKEFIAVVNGQPIPRAWIGVLEGVGPGLVNQYLPDLAPDPARLWTQRPALASVIRLALLSPLPKKYDQTKFDEMITELTADQAKGVPGDTDADWLATFGMTRREMGLLVFHLRSFVSSKPQPAAPGDGVLESWWQEHAAQLGRQGHFHTFRAAEADKTPAGATRTTNLVREAVALVHNGLPFSVLVQAVANDDDCGLTLDCNKELLPLDMKLECFRAVARLRPGEASPVVALGNLRWAAILVEWNTTPPPALENNRDQVVAAWQDEQSRQAIERRLKPLEQAASIHLTDDPAAAAVPADPSVFASLLEQSPDSPVALLCVFWQLAQAKDPGAAAALDRLLASEAFEPPALVALAEALRASGQAELADRCKEP